MLVAALLVALPLPPVWAQATARAPGAALERIDGFLPLRLDPARNRILLEIPPARLGRDFLYTNTLATGGGAPGLGLDRGEVGQEAVLRFERRGNRVHVVRDNWSVRALDADAAGRRAASESFPTSIVASLPVDTTFAGVLVVDATSWLLADGFGVAERMRRAQQGSYRVDRDRSWIDADRTRAFPRNTEVRVALTFTSDAPGGAVGRIAPDPAAVTFEQHHSLLALPDSAGFRPRRHDPRTGVFGTSFYDFAQGLEGTYRGGFANRWRLVPRDPQAYMRGVLTEPVTPIVYYLDPGIPEPYRTAFRDGGMWWNGVFEVAGFRNAFQVRDLPRDVDPLDARYNVLYWVHRSGPGPSVGPSFSDPRTGEIIKTVVRMDAYRSLVDYNIYAGLLPAAAAGGLGVTAEAFTMARRRQHVAHEIGHTLGLAHNFIASAQGRTSVMDYPVPIIDIGRDGQLDLSRAYSPGAGAWDSLAINFAYRWYPDERTEREGTARIIAAALQQGLRFIGDQHAGANGSLPEATRWVEGRTMFDAIDRTTRVRTLLMAKFDERAIQPGEPMALLNQRFAHVYLHHRYALEGVIKYVGGMDFSYALRGDGQVPARVLPGAEQRKALAVALDALAPSALAVPPRIGDLIPPAPPGSDGSYTWLEGAAGPAFDPISLAGGLATEVVEGLLDRERAARLVIFGARDGSNLSLAETMRVLVDRTFGAPREATPGARALQRVVQRVVVNTLLDRAGDRRALPEVRAQAAHALQRIATLPAASAAGDAEGEAHRLSITRDIARLEAGTDDPATRSRFPVTPLPWP